MAQGFTSGIPVPLPVNKGGTGVVTSTGTGNTVLSTSPTLVTPVLGTPTSGTLTNCTGLKFMGSGETVFSARNSGTQTVTTGVITKIQLNSEDFDNGGYFDNATNYRYTPLIAGKYLFTFYFIGTITTSASGAIAGYIYKNGAVVAKSFAPYPTAAELYTTVTCILSMNGSTDYIEAYGLLTPGTVVSAGCVLAGTLVNF